MTNTAQNIAANSANNSAAKKSRIRRGYIEPTITRTIAQNKLHVCELKGMEFVDGKPVPKMEVVASLDYNGRDMTNAQARKFCDESGVTVTANTQFFTEHVARGVYELPMSAFVKYGRFVREVTDSDFSA